jgi:phasin family protein
MKNVPEQFTQMGNAAFASAAKMSKVSMDSAEKLMALQLEFAKSSLADATKLAKAISSVKDVQDLASVRSVTAESAMEKLMGYSRQVYEVASDAQAEMAKLAEERMALFNQTLAEGVEKAGRSSPMGNDVAVTALKSTMAATTAAFDSFTKAARSLASYSDAGIKSASKPARK